MSAASLCCRNKDTSNLQAKKTLRFSCKLLGNLGLASLSEAQIILPLPKGYGNN